MNIQAIQCQPTEPRSYTPCLKKVAHHTLLNIFAQGWPIAKISTATESEIINEHKCVINVLICNVTKCLLPPGELTCIKLAINCACTKTAHILKVSELIVFLPVCCLLINCIGKPFFLLKQMLLPDSRHVSGAQDVPTRQCPAHRAKETVPLFRGFYTI